MKVVKMDVVDYIINECPDILLHGCNVQPNGMISGVAGRLRFVWPEIVEAHKEFIYAAKSMSDFSFAEGTWSSQQVTGRTHVFNCYTQYSPGANFKELNLAMVMYRFNKYAKIMLDFDKNSTFSMVPIGCGVGGSSFEVVYPIIHNHLDAEILERMTLVTNGDDEEYGDIISLYSELQVKETINKI